MRLSLTWREIFSSISPYLLQNPNDRMVKYRLEEVSVEIKMKAGTYEMSDHDFQTITVQLLALGLIETKYAGTTKGNMGLFWSLTPGGERLMIEWRTVRSKDYSDRLS